MGLIFAAAILKFILDLIKHMNFIIFINLKKTDHVVVR